MLFNFVSFSSVYYLWNSRRCVEIYSFVLLSVNVLRKTINRASVMLMKNSMDQNVIFFTNCHLPSNHINKIHCRLLEIFTVCFVHVQMSFSIDLYTCSKAWHNVITFANKDCTFVVLNKDFLCMFQGIVNCFARVHPTSNARIHLCLVQIPHSM